MRRSSSHAGPFGSLSLLATLGCALSAPLSMTAVPPASAQAIKFGAQIKAHVKRDPSGAVVDQAFTSTDEANLQAANVPYVRLGLVYDTSFVADPSNPSATGLNAPALQLVSDTIDLLTNGEKVVLTVVVTPAVLAQQASQYQTTHSGLSMIQAVNAVAIGDLNLSVSLANQKFGSRLYAIEIWNEPDGGSWWDKKLLGGSFDQAMTGICDAANVPSWGLPAWGYGFLALPYAAGAGDGSPTTVLYSAMHAVTPPATISETSCLAAVSAHYYTETPEQFTAAFNNAATQVGSQPIYLTEFGGTSLSTIRSEGAQAQLLLRYMLSFLASSPQPAFTSVYEWKDSCYATAGAQQFYGVTRDSYCSSTSGQKPALLAIEQLLALETGASYSGGTCSTGVVCSVTLKHSDYTYTVYWRSDTVTTYMNSVISDPTIDEKQLSTADPFTSRVPSTVPINQTPRVIRRVTTP